MEISKETARRFILGSQGLWPGRRWSGKAGTEKAMRAVGHLQLDPLDIGARAHDLILHSRVRGYKKTHYSDLVYKDKKFFEWGGWLATRPVDEWPYWNVVMERASHRYQKRWKSTTTSVVEKILELLESEGPKRNRDFKDERIEKQYRGRKASSLALYQLWISGKIVTSQRDRFERIYDLSHRFVPKEFQYVADEEEAELFLFRKEIAFYGISQLRGLGNVVGRDIRGADNVKLRERLLRDGVIEEVKVEGWKDRSFVLTESLPLLKTLEAGKLPKGWKSSGPTNLEEVQFLSPLDIVSARGRAKKIFDFEYIWEVYKPVHQRKWGYYTLPILWGDQLVGRIDPSLDRKSGTLNVNGLWLEDPKLAKNDDFQSALAAGFADLRNLFEAKKVNVAKIEIKVLKNLLG